MTIRLVLLVLLALPTAGPIKPARADFQLPDQGKVLVVDLTDQKITRWQDGLLVDESPCCTGRGWHSKNWQRYRKIYTIVRKQGKTARSSVPGKYNVATPYKFYLDRPVAKNCERMHGYHDIRPYPASHGCIRLPINYARKIYPWVEPKKTRVFVLINFYPPAFQSQLKTKPEPQTPSDENRSGSQS